ncbi:MAG: monovalent cation/H+ antiporter complex subunit F [Halofilum sp. (in: g-proteobacteria)]
MIGFANALAMIVLIVAMAAGVYRAIVGPTLPDRVLALNYCGTIAVLVIVGLGFFTGRPDFVDLALIYALINFVGTIALLKFFVHGDLGYTEDAEDKA